MEYVCLKGFLVYANRKNRRENGFRSEFREDFYEKMDLLGDNFSTEHEAERNLINVDQYSILSHREMIAIQF